MTNVATMTTTTTATTGKARRSSSANKAGSKWIRPERRRGIYARDGHRCVYCGAGVEDGVVLTLDHLVPRSLGGGNESTNLVTACVHCNSARRDLPVRAFIAGLADEGQDPAAVAARIRRQRTRKVRPVRSTP